MNLLTTKRVNKYKYEQLVKIMKIKNKNGLSINLSII